MATKVQLVAEAHATFGLGPALAAAALGRSTWYYHRQLPGGYAERHAALRGPLERIARQHPAYGYRRTTTELEAVLGRPVNQKVVRRLHHLWDLPLLRRAPRPRPSGVRQVLSASGPRANLVARLESIGPLEVVYTDFTELRYATGKAWLMVLLDHASKVATGWALGLQANTDLALAAWGRARPWLLRHRGSLTGLIVHHDRDSVYTGYEWIGRLLHAGVRLSYTLHGCRDNPEMESFHSRFKTENRSLILDAASFADLRDIVDQRLTYYNRRRRHSALGNQAPLRYLTSHFQSLHNN